jgi:hypothetical protein
MHRVGADHDLVGGAFIGLEFIGVQDNTYQHGVGFVEINDFHAVFGERDGGVRQNIFERGGQISYRLDLDGFDCQHVIVLVHFWIYQIYANV